MGPKLKPAAINTQDGLLVHLGKGISPFTVQTPGMEATGTNLTGCLGATAREWGEGPEWTNVCALHYHPHANLSFKYFLNNCRILYQLKVS